MHRVLTLLALLLATVVAAPAGRAREPAFPGPGPEGPREVVRIALGGPIADARAEVSGLAIAPGQGGERLVLFLAEDEIDFGEGAATPLAAISFDATAAATSLALGGRPIAPLVPHPVPWHVPDVVRARFSRGRDAGFEAVAVAGDRVAIAREQGGGSGVTLLLEGRLRVVDRRLVVRIGFAREIGPPRRAIPDAADRALFRDNKSYEAIVGVRGGWLLLYECGGATFVPHERGPARPIPMPAIPYRVTDATDVAADGTIWLVNYHFRGRECLADPEEVARDRRLGGEAAGGEQIERLVPVRLDDGAMHRVPKRPVWLRLDAEARNWEGVVRIVDPARGVDGALLVTDFWPTSANGTLLGFVSF